MASCNKVINNNKKIKSIETIKRKSGDQMWKGEGEMIHLNLKWNADKKK
jgi:hypothetical protein